MNTQLLYQCQSVAVVVSAMKRPRVHCMASPPAEAMTLDGQGFSDSGLGDWLGFCDWLRTRDQQIIGARIWLDEESELWSSVSECLNVELIEKGRQLLIYFGPVREFDDWSSCDQDFGGNRLLIGEECFAVTFNGAPTPQADDR